MTKTLPTEHGTVLNYDERALRGRTLEQWRCATVDVNRGRIILFANECVTMFRCGSHKQLLKSYEAEHGPVEKIAVGIISNGVLCDTVYRTQKRSYYQNCVTGEQVSTRNGWKYDAGQTQPKTTRMKQMKVANLS